MPKRTKKYDTSLMMSLKHPICPPRWADQKNYFFDQADASGLSRVISSKFNVAANQK